MPLIGVSAARQGSGTPAEGGDSATANEAPFNGTEPNKKLRLNGETARAAETVMRAGRKHAIPSYLRDVYSWAYLARRNAHLLDREAVVTTLLWGNSARLRRAALAEIAPGDDVLQAAHVYGRLIPAIAERVGTEGSLDVIDIAPLQAALCRRKLRNFPHARVRIADAAIDGRERYDVAMCFFLLHELPDDYKRTVVDSLLQRVAPSGKIVFIDYHGPERWHPLRGLMQRVFDRLEPFAETMWHHDIRDFASDPEHYTWRRETFFGGMYQKVVVAPKGAS